MWLILLFLGSVENPRPQTPAHLDGQFIGAPVWDGDSSAHSGPQGLESSAQSGVEVRATQRLLEIFAQGHASSQGATVTVPIREDCAVVTC